MVRVVQVCLLWTSALPTLALFCAAFKAPDYKDNSQSLATEEHEFDDRDPAFQGTAKDHRSVLKTLGDLQDSQTADTSRRQWRTRIDSNNGPWVYRSNWRKRDVRPKVGNWQDASFGDDSKYAGFPVKDYEDYYHDLDSVLDRTDYDYINWNVNYDYDAQYDYSIPLSRSQPNQDGSLSKASDTFIRSLQSRRNSKPGHPQPWEAIINAFITAQSREKNMNAHRSESSTWALPQSQLIASAPVMPTRINSRARIRDAKLGSKFAIQNVDDGLHASQFGNPVSWHNNNRGKKKRKKLSSNPLIRMREFLLGGNEEATVQEKKDDEPEQLADIFYHSVARERTLEDENTHFDSGGKANILLVLNKEGKDSISRKSTVSKSPQGRPDKDKKFSLTPIDFDKTKKGEPLIVIDVDKVTKLVQDDCSIRPDGSKKLTVNKKPVLENTRKPFENVDYSVPVLPSRLPHIEDYYGSLGNHDIILFSSQPVDTSEYVQNSDDISDSISDPLIYSDELFDYDLEDDSETGSYPHEQTSRITSTSPHVAYRKDPLFSERHSYSSGHQRVHVTRPKKINIFKTGIRHASHKPPPRPYGYPQTYSPYPPLPATKPYAQAHNPSHQLPYGHYGRGQNQSYKPPHRHQSVPHSSGQAHKRYNKGSSLIILENTYPKGNNNFPKETGIYEYEHESLSIPPFDHNPYVKEFSHFLPTDDRKDVLLEYTANQKEDINGVALLIARGNEQQKSFVPYEAHAPHSSNLRRRNFEEANGSEDDEPTFFAQLEFENKTSTEQQRLENNRKPLARDLGQLEHQISPARRRRKIRIIAPGSFSSLEEWTEDSSRIVKSGGGSIPEGSE